MRDKHSGFFTGLLGRNEKYLWLSIVLFFGSIAVGYIFSGFLETYLTSTLQSFQHRINNGTLKLETLSLFQNNVSIAFFIYLGGILIGAVTAVLLVSNGLFIGFVASKYPPADFLIYTVPHGIFEVTGIILAGGAGFRLGNIVLNFLNDVTKISRNISIKNQLSYLLKINKDDFKDSLTLFIIAAILLIIAAFIEANLTVSWGLFIQSQL